MKYRNKANGGTVDVADGTKLDPLHWERVDSAAKRKPGRPKKETEKQV